MFEFILGKSYSDHKPKISIIVPVFNNYDYLDECLESVLQQTLKDIEIIIIDDGSTDKRVSRKLAAYAARDKRINLVAKKNSGYGDSMNLGISRSTGEYIGIVESDDYIDKNMYKTLYSRAGDKPDIVKANGMFFKGPKENRKFTETKVLRTRKEKFIKNAPKSEFFRGIGLNQLGIFNRSFILDNNIEFSTTPGASFQDIGFFLLTAILAKKIHVINRPYYFVRRDNENSSVHGKHNFEAPVYEYKRIENYLNGNIQLKEEYIAYINLRKFLSYRFTLSRIANSDTENFMKIFRSEWHESKKEKQINFDLYTKDELIWMCENI